jgi:hypothetical protein
MELSMRDSQATAVQILHVNAPPSQLTAEEPSHRLPAGIFRYRMPTPQTITGTDFGGSNLNLSDGGKYEWLQTYHIQNDGLPLANKPIKNIEEPLVS